MSPVAMSCTGSSTGRDDIIFLADADTLFIFPLKINHLKLSHVLITSSPEVINLVTYQRNFLLISPDDGILVILVVLFTIINTSSYTCTNLHIS